MKWSQIKSLKNGSWFISRFFFAFMRIMGNHAIVASFSRFALCHLITALRDKRGNIFHDLGRDAFACRLEISWKTKLMQFCIRFWQLVAIHSNHHVQFKGNIESKRDVILGIWIDSYFLRPCTINTLSDGQKTK